MIYLISKIPYKPPKKALNYVGVLLDHLRFLNSKMFENNIL